MSESVFVVGAGTMGAGIAQVAAAAGGQVSLYDNVPGAASRARDRIASSLERAATKGYVTPEALQQTLLNLHISDDLEDAAAAAIVIEAVKEEVAIKQSVFLALEKFILPSTAIWTNTSMISIGLLSEPLANPERFCGAHFFNPVPRMKLVELIAGPRTAPSTIEVARETVTRWGKTPVLAPDTPGFLVNRILDAIKREALDLLDQGVPPDQVDTAVRLGLNFPMGPLELMDLIGLDTTLDCMINQARAMGRPAEFSPKITSLVKAGKTGRKAGEGFYLYDQQPGSNSD